LKPNQKINYSGWGDTIEIREVSTRLSVVVAGRDKIDQARIALAAVGRVQTMTAYRCLARGSVLRGRVVYRAKGWPWTQRSALVWDGEHLHVVVRRTLRRCDRAR
jgi:hypothetical protein